MSRIILCVDMDAFFASVEQKTRPFLKGKPIAVIGSAKRTVITTASYEARKYGVKTGMNIHEAKKVCPQLILVIGDNEKYAYTCRGLERIYLGFTPDVEVYSIDEAFLDITSSHHLFGNPEAVGIEIKREIKEKFGISCTVGIGPNKLIAKLAVDLNKPDGLRWIKPDDVTGILEDLPVKELWGIGQKISAILRTMGIKTCGELGRTPLSILRNRFGIIGIRLKAMGLGLDDSHVTREEEEPKSIGHSMTLPRDIGDRREIHAYLLRLSEMVGRRARRHGLMGKVISLVIRYPDFETFSKQKTFREYTDDTHVIYQSVIDILNSLRLRDKIRLLGVSLSTLTRDPLQLSLFKESRRRKSLLQTMDRINDRYGDFTLIWGSYKIQEVDSGVISPAWRPSGVRCVSVK